MTAIVLSLAAALVVLAIVGSIGMHYYDSTTRKDTLRVIDQELPSRASFKDMDEFMRRHTARYSYDDQYDHEFSGFLPQTKFDRYLFDRIVQVVLKVNEDKTYRNAEVFVVYTGP
jgi:hypothetical protein